MGGGARGSIPAQTGARAPSMSPARRGASFNQPPSVHPSLPPRRGRELHRCRASMSGAAPKTSSAKVPATTCRCLTKSLEQLCVRPCVVRPGCPVEVRCTSRPPPPPQSMARIFVAAHKARAPHTTNGLASFNPLPPLPRTCVAAHQGVAPTRWTPRLEAGLNIVDE